MLYRRVAAVLLRQPRPFCVDTGGVAGIEFALTGLLLAAGLMNAVDIGYYIFTRMEVENAAEAGAQAAWKNCNPQPPPPNSTTPLNINTLPATINCTALKSAITTAIQSTTLGTNVSLASGYPKEDYRCTDASDVLQPAGSISGSPPANCSAVGNASGLPGDYLQVQVSYPYQPLFNVWFDVMNTLVNTPSISPPISPITMTSWMRLDNG